jgi:outer membrane protein assembly factor BamB
VAIGEAPLVDDLKDAKLVWISEEQSIGTTWGPHGVGPGGQGRSSPCRSAGYGGPIVAGGRVFLQITEYPTTNELTAVDEAMLGDGPHSAQKDKRPGSWNIETHDAILCMDRATGRTLWKTQFRHKGLTDNGHRHGRWQYPVVVGNPSTGSGQARLYAQGSGGYVYCVDVETGKEIWVAGTGPATRAWNAAREAWKNKPQGYYQVTRYPFCSSPAWGDGVIAVNDHGAEPHPAEKYATGLPSLIGTCTVWGYNWKGNAMVGLDAATGEVLWRVEGCAGAISSPVRWRVDGKDYFISAGPRRVVCVEAKTGAERWRIEGSFQTLVDPTVSGNVLVTLNNYTRPKKKMRLAIAAYRITPEKAEKLWEEKPWTRDAWGCSPIVHEGRIHYLGRMYDAETGSRTNSGARPIGMGTSLIGGNWYFHYGDAQNLGDDGAVTGGSRLPAFGGEAYLSPTYADGRLYIRGTIPGSNGGTAAQRIKQGLPPEHGCVYCFDLRKNPSDAVAVAAAATNAPADPVAQLASPFMTDRQRAVTELCKRKPGELEPLVPQLVEYMSDGNWLARSAAAPVLQHAGPSARQAAPGLEPLLLAELDVANVQFAVLVMDALKQIDPASLGRVASQLAARLDNNEDKVVLLACELLGRCGPAAVAVAPRLIALVKEGDARKSVAALRALGAIEDTSKDVLGVLTETLKHEDGAPAVAAADALGDLAPRSASAIPALTEALSRRDGSVVATRAAAALRGMEALPPETLTALAACLAGGAVGLAGEAEEALVERKALAAPALIAVARAKKAPAAIRALGRIGTDAVDAAPALLDLAAQGNDLAAGVVMQVDPSREADLIAALAKGATVRRIGLMGLLGVAGNLGRRTANPEIKQASLDIMVRALESPDPSSVRAACEQLAEFGPAASMALPALQELQNKGGLHNVVVGPLSDALKRVQAAETKEDEK